MKKLVAIILAAVLMLALAVPAFADISDYNDFYLFGANPGSGRVLKKETYVYDDEDRYWLYDYGTWEGCKCSGWEYDYSDFENNVFVYRECLNGEWEDFSESELIYDEQGKIIGINYYNFDENGDKTKREYTNFLKWDEDGNVTEYEDYYHNDEGGFDLYLEGETEFTDGLITYQKVIYYSDGDIVLGEYYYYSYDEDGYMTSYEYYECSDESIDTYYFSWKEEYERDTDNRIVKILVYTYFEGDWEEEEYHYEVSYTETADGFVATTEYVSNSPLNAKVDLPKETEETEQISAEAKNEQLILPEYRYNVNKDVITLNENGEVVKHQKYGWDYDIEDWKAYQTVTYEYVDIEEEEEEEEVKPTRKVDTIAIGDESKNEENPNTGAPVISMALVAAVMAGAVAFSRKK